VGQCIALSVSLLVVGSLAAATLLATRSTAKATAAQHLADQERLITAVAVQQAPETAAALADGARILAQIIGVSASSNAAQLHKGLEMLAAAVRPQTFALLDPRTGRVLASNRAWDESLTRAARLEVMSKMGAAAAIHSNVVTTAEGPRTLTGAVVVGWGSVQPRLLVAAAPLGPEVLAPSVPLLPRGGVLSVLDGNGVVVSSTDTSTLGRKLEWWSAAASRSGGISGRRQLHGVDTQVIGEPVVGFTRSVLWTQPAADFYRASRRGLKVVEFGIVALVAIAGGFVMVSTHRRLSRTRQGESKVTSLLENTGDAVLVVRDRQVVQAWGDWQSNDWRDVVGSPVDVVLGAAFAEALQKAGESPEAKQRFDAEVVLASGSRYWVEATVAHRQSDPSIRGVVVSIHDVTERNELQRTLSFQASHDGLTGLANRTRFAAHASEVFERQRGAGGMSAIMYLDLNLFKLINDQFGHASGDHVLRVCAERLETCVRASDVVARLGGDEFAILLADTTTADTERIAARVRDAITSPIVLADGGSVGVGLSLGIAYTTDGDSDLDALLRDADLRMYSAKGSSAESSIPRQDRNLV
jgi:diguanylate cyclase (GGDEF)-like protein